MTSWIIRDGSPMYRAITHRWNCCPLQVFIRMVGLSAGHTVQQGEKSGKGSIRVAGVRVEMWHPKHPTISAHVLLPWKTKTADMGITPEEVRKAAERAARLALKKCPHTGAVFVKLVASSLRRFRCPACNTTFETDSSG